VSFRAAAARGTTGRRGGRLSTAALVIAVLVTLPTSVAAGLGLVMILLRDLVLIHPH
jgi:hypothetical protein